MDEGPPLFCLVSSDEDASLRVKECKPVLFSVESDGAIEERGDEVGEAFGYEEEVGG